MRYLPQLDGLRAIAVGMVLVFHAGFSSFPGGFIGVDIFFVISGFLITGIIVSAYEEKHFSLANFYIRRMARLLPALFVTILVTLLIGYSMLSPGQLEQLGASGAAAGLSFSNIFFWLDSGYFSAAANTKPLLHTWSLGVEEQFYILWPLVLIGALKLGSRKHLVAVIAVIAIVSATASYILTPRYPDAVFYLMPFRAHQFALGALLAVAFTLQDSELRGLASVAGLAILLNLGMSILGNYSGMLLESLLPALAAAVVIWGSESKAVKGLLSAAPLVWIGRRSYSIYLVHWPIGVYWSLYVLEEFTIVLALSKILASILVGALLHWAVESRFRIYGNSTRAQSHNSMRVVTSLIVVLLIVAMTFWMSRGLPDRVSPDIQLAAIGFDELSARTRVEAGRDSCEIVSNQQQVEDFNLGFCAPSGSSANGDARSYLILGDSVVANTYLVFREAYPEITFGRLSIPGCGLRPLENLVVNVTEYCIEHYQYAFDELMDSDRYEGVILTSAWQQPYAQVVELVQTIEAKGLRAIVVGEYLEFGRRIPDVVFSSMDRDDAQRKIEALANRALARRDAGMAEAMNEVTDFVEIVDFQCPDVCDAIDEQSRLMYWSSNYLTIAGAETIARRLRSAMPDLFLE